MGGNWSAERGVKRHHENAEGENDTSAGDLSDSSSSSDLHTPKRKRFQSTAQYIVKKLFEEGTDSDVTIQALGKSWHLHKIYLSQCRYFDSMFNRQWAESEQPNITIEITDDNITTEALRIAFKSLYTDNILVKPIQAVGVLAAATFLQLEPLIEHCRLVMKGCITCKTVCSFLAASECYGLLDIKDLCMNWLLRCLMVPKNAFMLSDIGEELLMTLLDSRDLWIMQVEVDVYCLLKKWVFTQLNLLWNGNSEQLYKDASDFYKQQAENNGCCFLETAEGRRFIHMFEKVRWIYIINDSSCIQSLKDDQIVPSDWLNPVFKFCWNHHLTVEQGLDIGPREVSEEDFYKWSMRCGRVLLHEQEYHWRWLGYAYGLDLLFTLRNKVLTISRNCGSTQRFTGSLSQQETRHVMLCVKVTQVKKKEMCAVVSTGIKTLSLLTDDVESFLLALNPAIKFPLQVTMQLLYVNPDPSQPLPALAIPPAPVDIVPSMLPPPSTLSSGSSRASPGGGEGGGGGGEGSSQRPVPQTQSDGVGDSPGGSGVAPQTGCSDSVVLQRDSPLGTEGQTDPTVAKDSGCSHEASRWLNTSALQPSSSSSFGDLESRSGNMNTNRGADVSAGGAEPSPSICSATESSSSVSTTDPSPACPSTHRLPSDRAPETCSRTADSGSSALLPCVDLPSTSFSRSANALHSDRQTAAAASPLLAARVPQDTAGGRRVRRSARMHSRSRSNLE